MDRKASDQIKAFLDFAEECRELNAMARSGVAEEDKRHQDPSEQGRAQSI